MIKKISLLLIFSIPLLIFSQELQIVRNSLGKYGFADKYDDTIIQCKYDYAEKFSGGLALVKNNLRHKVVDTAGVLYDILDYDGSAKFRHLIGEYHSGLPVIVEQWDCAYITSGGNIFLSIPYQNAESFISGKAKVFNEGKYNYITKDGLLLSAWEQKADDYHAIKNQDKFGYINKNGELVIEYQFPIAKDFTGDFALISNETYWAIINKKGKRLSNWYEKIHPFVGQLAMVEKLGNIGFINTKGKFMGEWYKEVIPLDFGLYKVKKYEQYAIVNNKGFLVTQWFDQIYSITDEGYIKVRKKTKFAYLNKIGALVVGWYDNIGEIKNGIIKIMDDNKYAFYNVEKFKTSSFFDSIGNFNNDLAIIYDDNKFGYINKACEIVIPIQYDDAGDFNTQIAKVALKDKVAYINTSGKIFMGWYDKKTFSSKDLPNGLIAVKFGRKYGFQTLNGRRVIPARFNYAESFKQGLALVKTEPQKMYVTLDGKTIPADNKTAGNDLRKNFGYKKDGKPITITVWKCSYINSKGKIVFSVKNATDAFSFNDGKAMIVNVDKYNYINMKGKIIGTWKELPENYIVEYKNGKYGYINKNGKTVIKHKFSYAYDFKNGLAKIRMGSRKSGKYALINEKGEYISKMYDEISDFYSNVAVVKVDDNYLIINNLGKEISSKYDKIFDFSEQLALVEKDKKYSFINIYGKQITQWFDEADKLQGRRARVKKDNKWGFIDNNGKIVVPIEYDRIWNFKNSIAKVEKNKKVSFINAEGKLITDWFDRIYFFSDERAIVVKDKKWGYINAYGKIVIKLIYDKAFAFSDGQATVIKNGKPLTIDKNGNLLNLEQ